MGVIGFSYSKFDCERKITESKGSIDINHNVSIKNVEKTALNVGGTKTEVLKIDFSFDVLYGASIGKISIYGDVVYTDTREIINEVFDEWSKNKKLNVIVNEQVFRFVYNKSIVKSLELADSLNLPSPVPLPKINFGNQTSNPQVKSQNSIPLKKK